MNRAEFAHAKEMYEVMETSERLLVRLGVGDLAGVMKSIDRDTLINYIQAGLEEDLDRARDELGACGVNLSERV